jgi:hypothetical protein
MLKGGSGLKATLNRDETCERFGVEVGEHSPCCCLLGSMIGTGGAALRMRYQAAERRPHVEHRTHRRKPPSPVATLGLLPRPGDAPPATETDTPDVH